MMLLSTRDSSVRHRWSDAVLRGLAPDGGLYLPDHVPQLSPSDLDKLGPLSFPELAYELCRLFISDEVSDEVIREICFSAFNFEVPLRTVTNNTAILELFHGPTCAFKDFGARFMARLFRYFVHGRTDGLTVLVATSGDTGSAVANAFFDPSSCPPIRVVILFPKNKVSLIQEKQMTTLGHNVTAVEVNGTFDDCQALVKKALVDPTVNDKGALTSANSINIARLLPQMFYYMFAALRVGAGRRVIFSVPSGNLGNLTAGIIGHLMGMPASHFIAACNVNAPFPEYIQSGIFRPHSSQETLSNAMDVGNPSNYARLLSLYSGDLEKIRTCISGARVTDAETIDTIRRLFRNTGYTIDPHTAVGLLAWERYQATYRDDALGIVLGTAHPSKFVSTVAQATGAEPIAPAQLRDAMNSPGNKIPLDNSYEQFKALLSN